MSTSTTIDVDGIPIRVHPKGNGAFQAECNLCGAAIGMRSIRNVQSIRAHKLSKNCGKGKGKATGRISRQSSAGSLSESNYPRGGTPLSLGESSSTHDPLIPPLISRTSRSHSPTPAASSTATPPPPSMSSANSTPTTSSPAPTSCVGVRIHWTPGSVWSTYPFQYHEIRKQQWEPIAFDDDMYIRLRSRNCSMLAPPGYTCCDECHDIPQSDTFERFVRRTSEAPKTIQHSYLNHRQMKLVFARSLERITKLQLRVEVGLDPCGFCGLEGCFVQMSDDGKHRILSNCKYHYTQMKYGPASTFSNATPCTNVTIHCFSCARTKSGEPRTIWKYNALYHISCEHPICLDKSGRLRPSVDPQLLIAMFISAQEEAAMGVKRENTDRYREAYGIPGSDDIQEMRDNTEREEEAARAPAVVRSTLPPTRRSKK